MTLLTLGGAGADWPQWRGPDRSNVSKETGLLAAWPEGGPPAVWHASGLGTGIQPVSVADGLLFTTGTVEENEMLWALDTQTGAKHWATRLGSTVRENALMRWLTQRSPTVAGDRVYLLTKTGQLHCHRTVDGRLLWRQDYPAEFGTRSHIWGYCDHPLVDGDRLICTPFGTNTFISVVLAEANPERYRETGRFRIPDPVPAAGVTFPVVANGRLYLRDDDRLHSYDISADPPAAPRPPPTQVVLTITPDELESPGFTPRPPRTGRDRAPDAVFVPTPHDVVAGMIELARGTSNSVWVDLGSGDGRIVIAAGRQLGCRAIGYEIDPKLLEVSRAAVVRERLESLVRIEHEDLFTRDLSEADIVTVFLYPRLMERLVPLLDKLRPGSRILSHSSRCPG